jgi:Tol biopolymer transport system component
VLNKLNRYLITFVAALLVLGCSLLGGKPPEITAALVKTPASTANAFTPANLITPAPAAAATPADNCPQNLGRIVFAYESLEKTSNNENEIYSMAADGSGRTRLTDNPIYDSHPAWSPGRCTIAFTANTTPNNDDIYVMDFDGSNKRQLTSDPARDMFPRWSPDGTQIAFISYRGGYRNLYIMAADGSGQRPVTTNPGEYSQWLAWSPDGSEIGFTFEPEPGKGEQGIYAIHPDGSGLRKLIPSAGSSHDSEPAWAPDGETIYFLSNRSSQMEIWRANADGSKPAQVSQLSAANVNPTHSLHVSPDGKKLIFFGVGPGVEQYNEEIYTLNIEGSNLKPITRSKGNDEWPDW